MRKSLTILTASILVLSASAHAATAPEYTQPKLEPLSVITEIPQTLWETVKYSFTRESIPAWATILGTSAVLYHYDDDLYDGARNTGARWGIGSDDKTKTVVKAFGFDLLRLPSDTGSALYFLGDGWIHMGIAAGFFTTGYFGDYNRAYNTGLQMVHGMVVSTFFSQALKRSTGRQSPNKSTSPRGRWRPFPSVKTYQAHTAEYDAYPSGHIMTATLVFTIINTNYPEYSAYVIPLEVLWLSALGFEMVNNGVHWASDYPLGIGIGYAVAKMATRMGGHAPDAKTAATTKNSPTSLASWTYFPSVSDEGPTINALYSF